MTGSEPAGMEDHDQPRPLTRRGELRRRQILAYAAKRFADHGYDATPVSDIVEGLGVGKGVFYWYFTSKEELFSEILISAQLELRQLQQQAIAGEADPVRRIELGIRASCAWLAENRHLLVLINFAAGDTRFAAMIRKGEDVAATDAARHVKEGMAQYRIREGDPLVLARAILGVVNHLTRTLVLDQDQDAQAVADAAISFCFHGLLV